MSLSLLVKSLIFMALALASGMVGREYAWPMLSYFQDARALSAKDARISKRSIVYRIPYDDHLGFAFSRSLTKAKVIVSPAVSEDVKAQKEGFKYGLRLRWIDGEGKALSEHDVFLQADSPDEVFASGSTWRYFRTRPELVAEQDHLLIESPAPAAALEIESFDVADGIVGVDVRVFQKLVYSGNQSLAAYYRLSDNLRDRMTQPNAFPDYFLSEKEKSSLARNQWRSVGARGLEGRDYSALVLYEAVREDLVPQSNGAVETGL